MILVDVIGGNTNCWAGTLGRHFFRTAQRGAFITIMLLTALLANGMVRAEIGGVVRGLVTDELTGRPITNADVAIITLDRITRTTRSDAGGVFEFACVSSETAISTPKSPKRALCLIALLVQTSNWFAGRKRSKRLSLRPKPRVRPGSDR